MATRKKLTPLEIASQLREAAKNPMDPALRKLIRKAVDMLISLSAPPPELEERFYDCCGASTQGPHIDECELPTMAKRIQEST